MRGRDGEESEERETNATSFVRFSSICERRAREEGAKEIDSRRMNGITISVSVCESTSVNERGREQ